jgi:hypothetical protein
MSDNQNSPVNILSIIAIAVAIVALGVGAVLPQASDLLLSGLHDVEITDATSNQMLIYNGTAWVNQNQTEPFTVDGWEDINFPSLSLSKNPSLSPGQGVILSSGSIQGLLFAGTVAVNEVFSGGEILHGYKEGSDLYPHVHWVATSSDVGNVTWFLEYSVTSVGDVYSAPLLVNVTQAATEAAWVHSLAAFPAINGSDLTIGSQIVFRLYRNATAPTDTYEFDAGLLSFGIHYQLDSVGSSLKSSK